VSTDLPPDSPGDRVVVGAAVVSHGRVLAARRSRPAHLAGGWELPGGKVEPGESLAQACVREVREELGCEVRVVDELTTVVPVSDGYVLRALVVELVDDEPLPLEHDAVRWLGPDELDEVPWLAPDLPLLDELRPLLSRPVHASFHEREDADAVAALVPGARVLRDRFAGEDDEEDVAWLVEAPAAARAVLTTLAEERDGWLVEDSGGPSHVRPLPLPEAPRRLKRPR
jgi:8-oxo-dGTP diphosphatase